MRQKTFDTADRVRRQAEAIYRYLTQESPNMSASNELDLALELENVEACFDCLMQEDCDGLEI